MVGRISLSIGLVNALNRALRSRGMTCRDLAAELKLSEAAVKRRFSRWAMSLLRLEDICRVPGAGCRAAELGADTGRDREPMARLSVAQEQALVDDPALMLAIFLTINRWRHEDVMRASISGCLRGPACW